MRKPRKRRFHDKHSTPEEFVEAVIEYKEKYGDEVYELIGAMFVHLREAEQEAAMLNEQLIAIRKIIDDVQLDVK